MSEESWVSEDFIYKSAADCLNAHPGQAAVLLASHTAYHELQAKCAELADALEFYSDEYHYQTNLTMTGLRPAGILMEQGARARKALKKYLEEK